MKIQTRITSFLTTATEQPIEDPHENGRNLICFTDGSTINNGAKDAKGGFATVWPFHPESNYSQHLPNSTNNKAEYSAIIHAIKQADELDPTKTKTLIIYTDSMLLINSMTKWISGWKRNEWKKSDGKPVLNQDLIKTIDELSKTRKVSYKHVRAHTNSQTWEAIHNDKADKMAKAATFNP